MLTDFSVDDALTSPFRGCMDNYGCGDPNAEWGNNILSNQLVVYGDGMISKRNAPNAPIHSVSSEELQLCKKISGELAARCKHDVGMGSESTKVFCPFFIAAQGGTSDIPTEITAEMIRAKFAGTIFPLATIVVEPLEPKGSWWNDVREDGEDEKEYLEPWHDMIKAFQENAHLHAPVFVQIGVSDELTEIDEDDYPEGTEMPGSVLPRMAVALTPAGSIVGLFGDVTHT